MAFCVILYPDSKGNEAVSVAPASPGNHLAARLETLSDVHFLKIIRTMEAKNKHSRKPRLVGGIVSDMLKGWHRTTDLAVDLKTILRSDRTMKVDECFSVERYALGVYNELCMALGGLVEEE